MSLKKFCIKIFFLMIGSIMVFTSCIQKGTDGSSNSGNEQNSAYFDKNLYYDQIITDNGVAAYDSKINVSMMKKTEEGKAYLEVDGKPFLMLGAQLRTDFFLQLNKVGLKGLDDYFKIAAKLNITVIQLPVCWKDIEPEKGVYKSDYIEAMIDYCNKYNLKAEFLWFGSYMCGYSVQGYIPDYIIENSNIYPSYSDYNFNGWLGRHWFLRADCLALREREKLAIEYMMNSIWEYDRYHGGRKTVIGIQVENEPDMLATRHNSLHGFEESEIWENLVEHLNVLGKAVKNSKYKCYTRVNMTTDSDYTSRYDDICNTDGIDFVGLDPYTDSLSSLNTYIQELTDVKNNYPHISENGGEFENTDQMILKCLKNGVGYEIFEVITTDHPFLKDWTLRGVYNPDFTKKAHTDRIISANKLYKDAYMDIVLAEKKNFLGFNLISNGGMEKFTETQSTENITIKWSTEDRGIAFAIERGDYFIVSSTQADKIEITGKIKNGEIGMYSISGKWLKIRDVNISSNNFILEKDSVYRFKIK